METKTVINVNSFEVGELKLTTLISKLHTDFVYFKCDMEFWGYTKFKFGMNCELVLVHGIATGWKLYIRSAGDNITLLSPEIVVLFTQEIIKNENRIIEFATDVHKWFKLKDNFLS